MLLHRCVLRFQNYGIIKETWNNEFRGGIQRIWSDYIKLIRMYANHIIDLFTSQQAIELPGLIAPTLLEQPPYEIIRYWSTPKPHADQCLSRIINGFDVFEKIIAWYRS